MEDYSNNNKNKRVRDDSEDSDLDSPEAKRIRDNLLDILEDSDPVIDRNPAATDDLASVMKSFEEEICSSNIPALPAVDMPSDPGEYQPDIEFLLEASDDDLGLPPTFSSSSSEEEKNEEADLLRVSSEGVGFGEIWGFDDQIPGYNSFGFVGEEGNNNDEFVALELDGTGGLFDYSDSGYEMSDFWWRPESLSAL